jgi:hypothetical protein
LIAAAAIGDVAACGFAGNPLGAMTSVDCASVAIVVAMTPGVAPAAGVLEMGIGGKELKLIQKDESAGLVFSIERQRKWKLNPFRSFC